LQGAAPRGQQRSSPKESGVLVALLDPAVSGSLIKSAGLATEQPFHVKSRPALSLA
jgi:hypothetical protein